MNSNNRASSINSIENDISLMKIKIEGLLTTEAFQRARLCALKLHDHLPNKFAKPEIYGRLQIAWHENFAKIRQCLGGDMWALKRPVIVFVNNELIGSDVEFIRYIGKIYAFNLPIHSDFYENLIAKQYKQFIENSGRKFAYFTFTIDDKVIGSFLIMLYTDLVPQTCRHFLKFCTSYKCKDAWGTVLSYKNTKVHRIVKNGWLQVGDILESNEDLDESVINEITIHDESYCIPHDRRGVISMANDGKHSNRDQFVVSLKSNEWMNCYYVAFGQLVDGANTLKLIENVPTRYEAPLKQILISECGEYSFDSVSIKKPKIEDEGEENGQIDDCDCDDDVASVIMVERYQEGLYSLSTDCLLDSEQVLDEN